MQPRKQGLVTKLMVLNLDLKTKGLVPPKVPRKNLREDPTKRKIVNYRMCNLQLKFPRKICTH
jgi:hypothetical protein